MGKEQKSKEQTNKAILPRILVPVFEAVAGDRATFDLVLRAAAERKVELLFEVPPAPQVVLSLSKGPLDTPCVGSISPLLAPDFLVLGDGYCKGLLFKPTVAVFDAGFGYRLEGPFTIGPPMFPGDRVSSAEFSLEWKDTVFKPPLTTLKERWWHKEAWTFWEGGMPFPYALRREDLFIVGSEFSKLMGWGEHQLTNPLVDDPVRRNVSAKLKAMRAAATTWHRKYGGQDTRETRQITFDKFNREKILPILEGAFGDRGTLATVAASMVRPVYARDKGIKSQFPHQDITVELAALFEAQRLWHAATLDDKTWPSNADIQAKFEELMAKWHETCTQNFLKNVPAILRPEGVQDRRHTAQAGTVKRKKA